MTVIAVVFDFDDTLMPDTTSALLEQHGIDAQEFWTARIPPLIASGYDPPLAYLNLLLGEVAPGRRLEGLTNQSLRDFGSSLDNAYFDGLPQMFDDLREIASSVRDVDAEFYVVSGGLREIIVGSAVIQKYFSGVCGCEFGEDAETGVVTDVKRCITFTEKTRYLFEINKGIDVNDSRSKPHEVNRDVPPIERRVPFSSMIYVGDGMTDIPCFSLLQNNGGSAFGVFDPTQEKSAKQAFQQFLQTRRVLSMHAPRYGETDELGALLRQAVQTVASQIGLSRQMYR